MKSLKNKKGISLIVLVITIIVMIILATAIILSLDSSNIVEKAKEAKTASDTANIKQAATLAYSEYVLDLNEGKIASGTTAESYVKSKLMSQGVAEENLKRLMVSEKGKIFVVEIPEGFVVSSVSTEDEISEGLVIRDIDGNEFVWVPVYDFAKFERTTTYDGTITAPGADYTEPYSFTTDITSSNDLTGEYVEYAAMRKSVENHGGFYIARYEAGKEGTSTVVSKKNATVWGNMTWGTSYNNIGTSGAVYLSRNMYPSSESVVSTLVYGVQWDAALQFIAKTNADYPLNSTNKGNYTGTLENTGIYMINNIYDMSGNADEWTMEACTSGRVYRGGVYGTIGSTYAAAGRTVEIPSITMDVYGFRVALYLK